MVDDLPSRRTTHTRSSNQRIHHPLMRLIRDTPSNLNPPINPRGRLCHPRSPSLRPQSLDLLFRSLGLAIGSSLWFLRRLRCLRLGSGGLFIPSHEIWKLIRGALRLGIGVGPCGREPRCVRGGSGHCFRPRAAIFSGGWKCEEYWTMCLCC